RQPQRIREERVSRACEAFDANRVDARLPDLVPRAQGADRVVLHETAGPEHVPRVRVAPVDSDRCFGEPRRGAPLPFCEANAGQPSKRPRRSRTPRPHTSENRIRVRQAFLTYLLDRVTQELLTSTVRSVRLCVDVRLSMRRLGLPIELPPRQD